MKTVSLSRWTTAALFAALTALCSYISLPIGPVPINLATLSVMMAGLMLGPFWGAASQLVYVLLGAVGLPVFSGFSGGIDKIVGPTGGYIVGYVAGAFVAGLVAELLGRTTPAMILAGLTASFAVYLIGTYYFMYVTGMSLTQALGYCVFPFLPGDTAKVVLSTVLVRRLWPVFSRQMFAQS